MGAESKSAAVSYLQQGLVDTRHRACRDRNLACPYSSAAALVLGAFVSGKFQFVFAMPYKRTVFAFDNQGAASDAPPGDVGIQHYGETRPSNGVHCGY